MHSNTIQCFQNQQLLQQTGNIIQYNMFSTEQLLRVFSIDYRNFLLVIDQTNTRESREPFIYPKIARSSKRSGSDVSMCARNLNINVCDVLWQVYQCTTCWMLDFLHALFLMVSYWQSSIIDEYYLRLNDLCLFRKTQVQITWYQYYTSSTLDNMNLIYISTTRYYFD